MAAVSFEGTFKAEINDAPKLHTFHKQGANCENSRDNQPRSLNKRGRIIKFGKYDHAGQCLTEKCDWLGLKFTDKFAYNRHSPDTSAPAFSSRIMWTPKRTYWLKDSPSQSNISRLLLERISLGETSLGLSNSSNSNIVTLSRNVVNYTSSSSLLVNRSLLRFKRLLRIRALPANAIRRRRHYPRRVFRREVDAVQDINKTAQLSAPNISEGVTADSVKSKNETSPAEPTSSNGKESRLPYDLDHDAYMALGSLTFLMVVLTSAVLYTGLWKKRNTMLFPDFIDRSQRSPSRKKTDIKALLKAKLGKVPVASRRIRGHLQRNHRGHNHHHRHYSELPLVENGDAPTLNDELLSSDGENDLLNSEEDEELW